MEIAEDIKLLKGGLKKGDIIRSVKNSRKNINNFIDEIRRRH